MRWICTKCGQTFVAPPGKHGFFDFEPPFCPNCHGEDVEDLEKCELCGREVPSSELNGHGGMFLCRACEAVMKIERDSAVKHIWDSGNKEKSLDDIKRALADFCEE